MRKALLVAGREYLAAVRTRAFVVSLVIMPIFMGGSLIAMKLLEGQVDTRARRIAVVDRSGAVVEALETAAAKRNASELTDPKTGKQARPAYLIERVPPRAGEEQEQRIELSQRVERGELHAFVEISGDVLEPAAKEEVARVTYHAKSAALDDARSWTETTVNARVRQLRLAAAHLDAATIARVTRWVNVQAAGLVSRDEGGAVKEGGGGDLTTTLAVPGVLAMMMFMVIVMGASPLINSVMEEKLQRIAEVLLGAVTPFQLMLGKLLGAVGVSLTIFAVYAGCAVAAASRMGMLKYVPYGVLPWFGVYLVAAVLLFGAMFVAVGSACNDPKEAHSAMMPVWLVLMVPAFVWFQVIKEPLSGFSTYMSLVPPFVPILMLLRQSAPSGVPAWQPWVGLAGMLLFTTLIVWAAGRIFRVGLLMQGKPPRPRDLLRWAIRG